MRRRSLLTGAAGLILAPAFASTSIKASPRRRVRPNDPTWPTLGAWQRLAARVGGRLVKPTPLFTICTEPSKSDACGTSRKEMFNPFFRGDEVSGTQVSGWYKAWAPELSAYAIMAHGPADVAEGVNFAREHNLRLAVKGPAHSYLGCSNAPDSLLIWTRPMNEVTIHEEFKPRSCDAACQPVPAVSVGGGAIWIDVYHAVSVEGGRYAQGGACTEVGVAGLVQGGGFGSLSKGFGTAGASLLEAEVVTADGRIRTVNAHRDPDLFWALKGGGGGNFAVVTRLTLKTHALPTYFGAVEVTLKAQSDQAFNLLLNQFFTVYTRNLLNPNWGEQVHVRGDNTLDITMLSQGISAAEMQAAWQPLLDWVADPAHDVVIASPFSAASIPPRLYWDLQRRSELGLNDVNFDHRPGAPAWHGWWKRDAAQVGVFLHGFDSVWLPRTLLDPDRRPVLVDALFDASRAHDIILYFNKGLAGAPPEAIAASRDTPMNPAVLDAFALAIVVDGGPPAFQGSPFGAPNTAMAQKHADGIDQAMRRLRKAAPHAGSYVAESNFFNENWREDYWGEHYTRLRRIKDRYDPDGLFINHHGVGSEDWSADGFAPRVS
jgi:FAD/FMN-containing dehydrogenase